MSLPLQITLDGLPGVITIAVLFIIVPSIMVWLFIHAIEIAKAASGNKVPKESFLASSAYGSDVRDTSGDEMHLGVSAWAGFWTGLVISLVFVISQLGALRSFTFSISIVELPRINWVALIAGAVISLCFPLVGRFLISTRLAGLMTLLLSAVSTSAFYSYVFIEEYRSDTMCFILGTTFGILFYRIVVPRPYWQ
jgi:hypothetical protein